jgi:hypothetical protein
VQGVSSAHGLPAVSNCSGAACGLPTVAARVSRRGLGFSFKGRVGVLACGPGAGSPGFSGGRCAPGKKGRRGRMEKVMCGDRLPDREKGGGAARAGAEGAGPRWLLGRGEKRGEGKEEVGRR